MSDEQQVRALLARAAELPDDVQPPVQALIGQARRRRVWRNALAVVAVAVVAAAGFTLPAVIRGIGSGGLLPAGSPPGDLFPAGSGRPLGPGPGPSAAAMAGFRWSTLPPSPLGARSQPLVAWAGRELIELGGFRKGVSQYDGAAFSPATGRWRMIAPVRSNVGFLNAVDVWTGHQLFVANGQNESCLITQHAKSALARCLPHAGLYDPVTNTWSVTLLPRQMDGLDLTAAVWTGRVVVLVGVNTAHALLGVAAYNPASGRWRMITPALPADHPPVGAAIVATPDRLILWSLWSKSTRQSATSVAVASGIDVLALGPAGQWHTITGNWPQHKVVADPAYSNGTILIPPGQIWCGICSHPSFTYQAELTSPRTLDRTPIPAGPLAPHPGIEPGIWLWTGRAAIAANTSSYGPAAEQLMTISQLGSYNPATKHWHLLPLPPGSPPIAASPLWTPTQLLLLTATGKLLAFRAS